MIDRLNILLVEDEPNFGAVLKSYLELAKYKVVWCKNGKEAFSKFQNQQFQLCILDVMMPEMDGFSLGREIKSIQPQLPFIFLTAKSLKEDILQGFKIGAEDYLTKPFDSDILLEKIKVILKKQNQPAIEKQQENEISIGQYTFIFSERRLKLGEDSVKLTPKEALLLNELAMNKNQLTPRSYILQKIWKEDNYFTRRSMDVFVAKLRKYFSADPNIQIETIYGSGFLLRIDDQ